jgi:ubiquinone/menaquinone biosynthesis C-methylase UbiE
LGAKVKPIPKTKADLDDQGFVLVNPNSFVLKKEKVYAKNVWKNYGVKNFYKKDHPWLSILDDVIGKVKPKSVLEFGTMVGRNLRYIKSIDKSIKCVGIDINKDAISFGKKNYKLDLRVGDEKQLAAFKDKEFDLVFTVSVLDHIPRIDAICSNLIRCAKKAVFCLEISLPVEGRIVKLFDRNTGKVRDAIGATYSWHIHKHFKSKRIKDVTIRNEELDALSGPYYKYYLFDLVGLNE